MAIYRAFLVWALRAASALVLALAAFGAVSAVALYHEVSVWVGPDEMVPASSLLDFALQLVPAVGLALLVLAIAEILAMQLKNAQKS